MRFFVVLTISLVLGCAPASVLIKTGTEHVPFLMPSTDLSTDQLRQVAKANAEDLRWFREHEWPLHRNPAHRSEAPKQCVALSGGGIRSAAFSLGVMKGLQNTGLWSKVDAVSAVSGGSYALSWYLAQQYKSRLAGTKQSDADILSDKPLDHLAERAEFVRTVDTVGRGFKTTSPVKWPTLDERSGCSGLGTQIFLHLPPVGPMCTAADYQHRSEDGVFYARRIADTFHRNDITDEKEALALSPIPLEKLHTVISDQSPYFVINATVQYSQYEDRIPLSGRVFEFTQLRMGSSGVGFLPLTALGKEVRTDERFPRDLATVVSIAGAALDGENERLDWWQQIFLKYWSKSNLGYRLPALDEGDRAIGNAIVLTDGGHSENLGVFSLVRRSCENILVVDAGEDPAYSFEDFRRLSQHLHKEYGASLRIPGFPKFESDIVIKQAADDNCVRKGSDKGSSYDCKTAVYEGSLDGFPILAEDGTVKLQKVDITYIKLSASRAVLADPILANTCYGPIVHDWYKQGDDPKFPHYLTKDQSWTKQQFLAYVSLGEHHVRNYLDPTYKNKCGTTS